MTVIVGHEYWNVATQYWEWYQPGVNTVLKSKQTSSYWYCKRTEVQLKRLQVITVIEIRQ